MATKKTEKLLTDKCTVRINGIPCVIGGDTFEEMIDEFAEARNLCYRCHYDIRTLQQTVDSYTAVAEAAKALRKLIPEFATTLKPRLNPGVVESEDKSNTTQVYQIMHEVMGKCEETE